MGTGCVTLSMTCAEDCPWSLVAGGPRGYSQFRQATGDCVDPKGKGWAQNLAQAICAHALGKACQLPVRQAAHDIMLYWKALRFFKKLPL